VQRLALPCLSALLLVNLAACDKPTSDDKDKQAADAKQAKSADKAPKGDAADKAPTPDAADKAPTPEGADKAPAADPDYVDDTKGLGMIVREIAVDTGKPEIDPSKAPKYDTSKDEGGMIGHIASALAHDEELAESATSKELLKLAGLTEPGPGDGLICSHVWTDIYAKAYPTKTDAEDSFLDACKAEVERERVKLGVEIFAQHAECVTAATELAALDLCDAAAQVAELYLHANPHGDRPEQSLCTSAVEQLFILVTRDIGDDADMLEKLEEDIYAIKDDAVLVCRDEGTKAELACIMKATKLADLEGC
jgi:hypothetical protein